MPDAAHNKMHHYFKTLLCHIFICMFVLCALDVESDLYSFSDNAYKDFSFIESLDVDSDNILSNEDVEIVFIKNANSRNIRSGKNISSRKTVMNSMISLNWVSSNICTILGIYSFKTLISSRHLIMSYIHNQDGMKL